MVALKSVDRDLETYTAHLQDERRILAGAAAGTQEETAALNRVERAGWVVAALQAYRRTLVAAGVTK